MLSLTFGKNKGMVNCYQVGDNYVYIRHFGSGKWKVYFDFPNDKVLRLGKITEESFFENVIEKRLAPAQRAVTAAPAATAVGTEPGDTV